MAGGQRNLYFLRWKQSGDSCTSRYVGYEYICEKICAVSSSVYLPFRGRLSTAQRPDGLKATPTSAGILSSLSKYLYHLGKNPKALACSIQIVCKDVLRWGCSPWVNTILCPSCFCGIFCHLGGLSITETASLLFVITLLMAQKGLCSC